MSVFDSIINSQNYDSSGSEESEELGSILDYVGGSGSESDSVEDYSGVEVELNLSDSLGSSEGEEMVKSNEIKAIPHSKDGRKPGNRIDLDEPASRGARATAKQAGKDKEIEVKQSKKRQRRTKRGRRVKERPKINVPEDKEAWQSGKLTYTWPKQARLNVIRTDPRGELEDVEFTPKEKVQQKVKEYGIGDDEGYAVKREPGESDEDLYIRYYFAMFARKHKNHDAETSFKLANFFVRKIKFGCSYSDNVEGLIEEILTAMIDHANSDD